MVSVAVQKRGGNFYNSWEGSLVCIPDVTLHGSLGKLIPDLGCRSASGLSYKTRQTGQSLVCILAPV